VKTPGSMRAARSLARSGHVVAQGARRDGAVFYRLTPEGWRVGHTRRTVQLKRGARRAYGFIQNWAGGLDSQGYGWE
jgi:hypothetical protein